MTIKQRAGFRFVIRMPLEEYKILRIQDGYAFCLILNKNSKEFILKNFRTLDLAVKFYGKVEELKLKGNLRDQLERAASSISLNLSEGNAKRTEKEKKRYYHTAYASVQECKTILRLIKNKDMELEDIVDHLGASIFCLLKSDIRTLRNPVYR